VNSTRPRGGRRGGIVVAVLINDHGNAVRYEYDAAGRLAAVERDVTSDGTGVGGFVCMAGGRLGSASAYGSGHGQWQGTDESRQCEKATRNYINRQADELKETFNPDGHCTFTDKFGCITMCERGDMRCVFAPDYGDVGSCGVFATHTICAGILIDGQGMRFYGGVGRSPAPVGFTFSATAGYGASPATGSFCAIQAFTSGPYGFGIVGQYGVGSVNEIEGSGSQLTEQDFVEVGIGWGTPGVSGICGGVTNAWKSW
jgi:hypothetical protein